MSEEKKAPCPFCEDLAIATRIDRQHERPGCIRRYMTRLAAITEVDGETRGNSTFRAVPLNFCPTCGRIIRPDEQTVGSERETS